MGKRYGLAAARLANGLTQEAMAEKVGMSCRQYQNIEWGVTIDPKYGNRKRIAEILGVSMELDK